MWRPWRGLQKTLSWWKSEKCSAGKLKFTWVWKMPSWRQSIRDRKDWLSVTTLKVRHGMTFRAENPTVLHTTSMLRFLHGSSATAFDDIKMAIDRGLQASNSTSPPVPPQKEIETMPVNRQPPTSPIPHQNIEPATLAFIEKQQSVINACMAQVSQ